MNTDVVAACVLLLPFIIVHVVVLMQILDDIRKITRTLTFIHWDILESKSTLQKIVLDYVV